MYTYFIYYTLVDKHKQSGDGNVDVTVDSKIDSIEKIRELEKTLIEEYGFESVVISNFICFGAYSVTGYGALKIERIKQGMTEKEQKVLDLIEQYGGIDGAHHKDWLLDQLARILTGGGYEAWVVELKSGEDGSETYGYNEGIAP